jgi:uncharacterized membrane protein
MAALVTTGAITWAVVRNANPSTPAAVKDVNTLVAELTTLNGYLATTNSLMSNAIANSQQLSAKAQAQLASLSTQLAGVDASLSQARSLLGDQLSGKMRNKLAKSQEKLQSRAGKLAGQSAHLQQQGLSGVRRDVGAVGTRLGAATSAGTQRASALESQVTALEAQTRTLQAQVSGRETSQSSRRPSAARVSRPDGSNLSPVTYEQWITEVVKVVETVGTGIMVIGGLGAFLAFLRDAATDARRAGSYERLRRNLGRCILLGLEVLIVADIVRTVVDQTFESVTVLGIIVLIRILLSFSLDVEIDGVWPLRAMRRSPSLRRGVRSSQTSPTARIV